MIRYIVTGPLLGVLAFGLSVASGWRFSGIWSLKRIGGARIMPKGPRFL